MQRYNFKDVPLFPSCIEVLDKGPNQLSYGNILALLSR
jgi:hypothetical protein